MRHLQLVAVALDPSTLNASAPDAPNGVVHARVLVMFRDAEGNMYADPNPAPDLDIRDAAIGQMARDLMTAVAAKLADSAALPVRDKADMAAPLVQPRAR